ncbi:DUF3397 domain-containing protein [Bacillus shivajii]|uniref:DUF3397 domain-containing protein n=1 Tax=Bacillus shivajii TaxID=1983719 RepID=UPI001CFB3E99|nr:DUF3397 domain-containing protein [Bacillus shivajii]UCZ51836.1 DUF3397 domain-containing protein [Bacillus shivajii]
MSSIIVFIIASFVTVPLIAFYLVYIISVKSTKNKVFSIKLAADCTVVLLMFAIYFIALEIWGISILWMIILFFLLSSIIFTILHWKSYELISIHKVFKGVWRFQFFVLSVLYFILMVYGFIANIYAV